MNEVAKHIVVLLICISIFCLIFAVAYVRLYRLFKADCKFEDIDGVQYEFKKDVNEIRHEINEIRHEIEDKNNIISLEEMIKMYDKEFSETSYISRQNTIYLKELKCKRYEVEYFRLQTIRYAEMYLSKINKLFDLNKNQYDAAFFVLRETLKEVGIMDADSLFINNEVEKKEGAENDT